MAKLNKLKKWYYLNTFHFTQEPDIADILEDHTEFADCAEEVWIGWNIVLILNYSICLV